MKQLFEWVRPKVAIPAHGETAHLSEHAAFARSLGVPQVIRAFNGDVVRLTGEAAVVDHVQSGRIFKDGSLLIPANDRTLQTGASSPSPASCRSPSRSTSAAR